MTVVLLFLAFFLLILAIVILTIVATWQVFERAGKPGWACIVPFYQGWTLAKIGGKPGWWGLIASLDLSIRVNGTGSFSTLGLTTLTAFGVVGTVATIFYILISIGVAHNFGKSTAFGFLLAFLPFVGYPMLAFGHVPYKKTA